ncbi:MAG TPA: hypothetical protein VFH51_10770, partial [Myxococcota bacterium]|nr:hypothetical protein [Myxococcota bacterium]
MPGTTARLRLPAFPRSVSLGGAGGPALAHAFRGVDGAASRPPDGGPQRAEYAQNRRVIPVSGDLLQSSTVLLQTGTVVGSKRSGRHSRASAVSSSWVIPE